jgi:hypothetical protein
MADIRPFHDARDALLRKIEEDSLADDELSSPKPGKIAKEACLRLIKEGGMIQAAMLREDPEDFINRNVKLAIAFIRQDVVEAGDPNEKAIIILRRAIGLPKG